MKVLGDSKKRSAEKIQPKIDETFVHVHITHKTQH